MSDELSALKARVSALEKENSDLRVRYAPDLNRRVTVDVLIKNVDRYMGTYVGVGGWIRTARASSKELAFLKIFDGTVGVDMQVVVNGETEVEDFHALTSGSTGASVFVEGKIVPSPGKEQRMEIVATKVKILGLCDPLKFPLSKSKLPLTFLREHQHMRPRSRVIASVTRVRNALTYAVHTFFQQQGYQYIHTPLITASDCEGAGEMFQVTTLLDHQGKLKHTDANGAADYSKDFFKKPAFLTVSGQLNAEIFATAMSSVYTFGPTFRAENSNTIRHLAEFWMIEPEIAFADLEENMKIAEAFVKFTIAYAMQQCPEDVKYLETLEIQHNKERATEEAEAKRAAAAKKKEATKAAQKEKSAADKAAKANKPAVSEDTKQSTEPKKAAAPKAKKEPKVFSPEEKVAMERITAASTKLVTLKKSGTASAEEIASAMEELNVAKNNLRTVRGEAPQDKSAPKSNAPQKKQPKQQQKKEEKKTEKIPQKWNDIPLRQRLTHVLDSQFARVTYTDAIAICQQAVADKKVVFEEKLEWGSDMGSEHERYLCEVHFNAPTIVYNYPKSFKSFYMRANEDGKTVAAMDVLVPGVGELIGGSQREERADELASMMREKGLIPEDYEWYMDLRRFGSVPHSGFGLGFERLVCYTTGMSNIRDAIAFPRFPGHCEF